MSRPKPTCPNCNSTKVHEVKEEVGIGVGVQEHFIGWDCEACGWGWAPELPPELESYKGED